MFYFAYGSNLNLDAMRLRCPRAVPLGRFWLADARLVFRGVADCVYEPGSKCPGGLWRISSECEVALDRYEGIGSGFYRKEFVPFTFNGTEEQLLYYAMNSTGIFPPSAYYLAVVRQGYCDFKLPLRVLNDAVRASWDEKAPTFRERQRHRRKGRPALAARPRQRSEQIATLLPK